MRAIALRLSAVAFVACAITPILLADGGTVQIRKTSGPFTVTLFSSTNPLRTGPQDLSVLVESTSSNQPVLDAAVELAFTHNHRQLVVSATHEHATNKLLYAAAPALPVPGDWPVSITVSRNDDKATVRGELTVLPGPPSWLSYWPYFAVVPVGIGLYILNRHLKSNQPSRT